MGTWRASSEADTRQDARVKRAKMADALTLFMLKVQEIVRKEFLSERTVCVEPRSEEYSECD